uniref:Uncharacterized protein n=1 Tax=Arundo donax TaxID=35708 RepID=A0A0A9FBW8_ARUDO
MCRAMWVLPCEAVLHVLLREAAGLQAQGQCEATTSLVGVKPTKLVV